MLTKIDEVAKQGQENGTELKMLRRELGLDGPHGRLPFVEATLTRHETRMEKNEADIAGLKAAGSESTGRQKIVAAVWAIVGGSAGAALITLLDHLMMRAK
jgi:hypothetical protein